MKKILVIEDNQSILAIIIDILEANFLVIVAKNGREGIEKAQRRKREGIGGHRAGIWEEFGMILGCFWDVVGMKN